MNAHAFSLPAELTPVVRAPKPLRFQAVRLCDIPPPDGEEWLIKGVLPKEGVGTFFGDSGHHKSFIAIDLAWHIAAGKSWGGRRATQATAVYLAVEGAGGIGKRLYGARQRHSLGDLPLHTIKAAPNLGTTSDDALAMIADIEAQGVRPGLIVVDTLAASMAGGDENGPRHVNVHLELPEARASLRLLCDGGASRWAQRREAGARAFVPQGQRRCALVC